MVLLAAQRAALPIRAAPAARLSAQRIAAPKVALGGMRAGLVAQPLPKVRSVAESDLRPWPSLGAVCVYLAIIDTSQQVGALGFEPGQW